MGKSRKVAALTINRLIVLSNLNAGGASAIARAGGLDRGLVLRECRWLRDEGWITWNRGSHLNKPSVFEMTDEGRDWYEFAKELLFPGVVA